MRVMVIVKASKESEAGEMPTEQMLTDMGKYNEELVNAGVMQAGDGLHPSSKGKRVRFSGAKRTVIDGPFPETKELVAGFWLWNVKSMADAVDWLKRAPFDGGDEVEIRPLFETEDFGKELTPELREQEERLRARIAPKRLGTGGWGLDGLGRRPSPPAPPPRQPPARSHPPSLAKIFALFGRGAMLPVRWTSGPQNSSEKSQDPPRGRSLRKFKALGPWWQIAQRPACKRTYASGAS